MGNSQKRAIQNYRSRLSKRGLARFEVLGRNADRDLIRSLAKRLSEDTPEALELRATVSRSVGASRRNPAASLPHCVALRLSEPISTCLAPVKGPQGRPVTRYLLDTNIISNVVKPRPSESLMSWLSMQRDEDLFIASLTVAEIRRGILEKPRGKKRDILDHWFAGSEGPQALCGPHPVVRRQGGTRLGAIDGRRQSGRQTAKHARHDHRRRRQYKRLRRGDGQRKGFRRDQGPQSGTRMSVM